MNTSDKRIWLFDLLRRHPEGLTREEIGEEYYRAGFPTSSVTLKNGRSRNEIPRETFNRVKRDLKEKYGVEVVCNPSTYTYSLPADYEDRIDKATLWLLDSNRKIQNIRANDELRNRVMMEGLPEMGANLQKVMKAIGECRTVNLPYSWVAASVYWCDFFRDLDFTVSFNPYGLRCYEGRWYAVGIFDKSGLEYLKLIAENYDGFHKETGRNDRDLAMKELKNRYLWAIQVLEDVDDYSTDEEATLSLSEPGQYEIPEGFDIEKVYENVVGPDIMYDMPMTEVIVKAQPRATIKLNANPIHHSQDILEEEPGVTYFVFYLRPSKYFLLELMKYGDSIEIIQPEDLKRAYESVR